MCGTSSFNRVAKSLFMRITILLYPHWLKIAGLIVLASLLSSGILAATTPVNGTTTFNNAFSATGNLLASTPSPATVTNVGNTSEPTGILPTGWDFTVTAPGANVSLAAIAAGANPGGGSDFCIRVNSLTVGTSVQTAAVKSNDGSAFDLQTVYLRLNITAGAPANITITGYRSGSAVIGATATVTGIATNTWTLFDISAVAAFANVDEFRFSQVVTSATISFMAIDQITIAATSLPLTLINFSGQRAGNDVRLDWTTASEQNTALFEVQRGTNGADFSAVGQVQAAGNSTQTLQYTYTDALPTASATAWLYRLKLADLDGRFTYSPVLRISAPATGLSFSAYPNPFRQQVVITAEAAEAGKAQLTMRDMGGKLLLRQDLSLQKGASSFSLPSTAQLGKGIYLLNIATSHGQQTLRLVKTE